MKADAIFIDGLIFTGAAPHEVAEQSNGSGGVSEPTAMAVTDGRVVAVGTTKEILGLATPDTLVTNLGGRRVIPGLIDAHMHATRAGATWDQELHWTRVTSLKEALESIRRAASTAPDGMWIRAVGGWHATQFEEGRPPTREELDEAGGGHPVYVQSFYDMAVLNSVALKSMGFDTLDGDPPGGVIERTSNGEATGVVTGMGAFAQCLVAMGQRSADEQRASMAAMMQELHGTGLTGIVDPGGFGMPPESYDVLFDLWRRGDLTMRMRLFFSAVDPGKEYEQLNHWLRHAQSQFGDESLRLIGLGEVVHYGCHDLEGFESDFLISTSAREELLEISRRTAERGWPMHVHAILDTSIEAVLDCWERVNEEFPLRDLRFALVHVDRISPRNIARLRALGVGAVVDDRLVFKAAMYEPVWSAESIRRVPPLRDLLDAGVHVAAGTDASRAASYDPWLALWWLVEGQSLDGVARRHPEQRMTREQALHAYTVESAWLSFEEGDRGLLRAGARADFAVLDADYFTVAAEKIRAITSDLTVVGGRHVHSSGAMDQPTPYREMDLAAQVS
jgi:predicted amidohydrolase YtcJ